MFFLARVVFIFTDREENYEHYAPYLTPPGDIQSQSHPYDHSTTLLHPSEMTFLTYLSTLSIPSSNHQQQMLNEMANCKNIFGTTNWRMKKGNEALESSLHIKTTRSYPCQDFLAEMTQCTAQGASQSEHST